MTPDPLAVLLHELRVGCIQPASERVCDPADPRYADFHPVLAARLRDAGVEIGLRGRIEAVLTEHADESDYSRFGGDALIRDLREALAAARENKP